MKFKMAAMAGLSLTLDPMGKSISKHFHHFPIGSNVNLRYFLRWQPSWISDQHKKPEFCTGLPMIIPGQLGKIVQVVSERKHFETLFPIGSNVKLSPAVAAIFHFISEQKT
jgi:hypothetical protein